MSIQRVLLCVDGSPAALAAARLTVSLAHDWGAHVRAIFVAHDGSLASLIDRDAAAGLQPAESRLAQAASGVLSHVEDLGRAAGVEVETRVRTGEPFEEILREARDFGPDVIAIGRSGRRGPRPTVGALTAHLLEFTEWPVIVVPSPDA